MKIALRDDDTSYYTKVSELESAFSDLKGFPISFAVVPYAVTDHAGLYPYGHVETTEKYADVADNQELVAYIKKGIRENRFEVLQHGICHELHTAPNGKIHSETDYLEKRELEENVLTGKTHLEAVFESPVCVFAAPCNAVSARCSAALDKLGMNVNFIMRWRMIREISIPYLISFLRSNIFRLFTGVKFGGVLTYRNHKEMNIYEFISYEAAWQNYLQCKKYNFPMVMYTHYWDLNKDEKKEENSLHL